MNWHCFMDYTKCTAAKLQNDNKIQNTKHITNSELYSKNFKNANAHQQTITICICIAKTDMLVGGFR